MTTPDRDEPRSPVRSCIGCRTRRTSLQLVRITRVAGDVVVGAGSSGRGAWLCRAEPGTGSIVARTCLDAAIARRAFAKAWRATVDADDEGAIRAAVDGKDAGNDAVSDDGGGR